MLNIVFFGTPDIGLKSLEYLHKSSNFNVLAVVTQFNEGSDSVLLRARGQAISRAVDAAEIVRNRFVPDADVTDIRISTEEIENYNNEKTNVSIIEILIEKSE